MRQTLNPGQTYCFPAPGDGGTAADTGVICITAPPAPPVGPTPPTTPYVPPVQPPPMPPLPPPMILPPPTYLAPSSIDFPTREAQLAGWTNTGLICNRTALDGDSHYDPITGAANKYSTRLYTKYGVFLLGGKIYGGTCFQALWIKANTNEIWSLGMTIGWPEYEDDFSGLTPGSFTVDVTMDGDIATIRPMMLFVKGVPDPLTKNVGMYPCLKAFKFNIKEGYFYWATTSQSIDYALQSRSYVQALPARMTVAHLQATYPDLEVDWEGFERDLIAATTPTAAVTPLGLVDILSKYLAVLPNYNNCQYLPYPGADLTAPVMPWVKGVLFSRIYMLGWYLPTWRLNANPPVDQPYLPYGRLRYMIEHGEAIDWEDFKAKASQYLALGEQSLTATDINFIDNYLAPALSGNRNRAGFTTLVDSVFPGGVNLDLVGLSRGLVDMGATVDQVMLVLSNIPYDNSNVSLSEEEILAILELYVLEAPASKTFTFTAAPEAGKLYFGGIALDVSAESTSSELATIVYNNRVLIMSMYTDITDITISGNNVTMVYDVLVTDPVDFEVIFVASGNSCIGPVVEATKGVTNTTAEVQNITVYAPGYAGSLQIGDVTIEVAATDSLATIKAAITALIADLLESFPTIDSIAFVGDVLTITYLASAGDVPNIFAAFRPALFDDPFTIVTTVEGVAPKYAAPIAISVPGYNCQMQIGISYIDIAATDGLTEIEQTITSSISRLKAEDPTIEDISIVNHKVFITYNTSPTGIEAAAKVQHITFTAPGRDGTYVIGGVGIPVLATDTAAGVRTKVLAVVADILAANDFLENIYSYSTDGIEVVYLMESGSLFDLDVAFVADGDPKPMSVTTKDYTPPNTMPATFVEMLGYYYSSYSDMALEVAVPTIPVSFGMTAEVTTYLTGVDTWIFSPLITTKLTSLQSGGCTASVRTSLAKEESTIATLTQIGKTKSARA